MNTSPVQALADQRAAALARCRETAVALDAYHNLSTGVMQPSGSRGRVAREVLGLVLCELRISHSQEAARLGCTPTQIVSAEQLGVVTGLPQVLESITRRIAGRPR